jgi:HEAT repeat protein
VDELVRIGRPAAERLIDLCATSGSPAIREKAVTAMGFFGRDAEVVVPALAKALNDQDATVRREAFLALVFRIGEPAAPMVGPILDAIRKEPGGVAYGLYELGRLGPAAIPALVEALKDPRCRRYVIIGLGQIGPKAQKALPEIRAALTDEDKLTRVFAAKAFWLIAGDPKAIMGVLRTALANKRDDNVRCQAAVCLGTMGASAGPLLFALKKAHDIERVGHVKEAMARALAKISHSSESATEPEDNHPQGSD